MLAIAFLGGSFRSLLPGDRAMLAAHWQRLPPESLARRFLRAMSAEALAAQAQATLAPPAEAIGWFRDGVLRGVAELHPDGETAEAAFTVEPGWRRLGIGRSLFGHAALRARNRGFARLVVMTTRDNFPMLRIAMRAGARIEREGAEVTGILPLAPATPASLMIDAGEETAAQWLDLAGSLERMARAWQWSGTEPPAPARPGLDNPRGSG